MTDFYLSVGDEVVQERLVTGAAIDAFADVSGDHSPNHVDDADMSKSPYGGRIAHGALLIAYMSACSTKLLSARPAPVRPKRPFRLATTGYAS
jgi:3-hydroxybutyryl-CoA dehydratase